MNELRPEAEGSETPSGLPLHSASATPGVSPAAVGEAPYATVKLARRRRRPKAASPTGAPPDLAFAKTLDAPPPPPAVNAPLPAGGPLAAGGLPSTLKVGRPRCPAELTTAPLGPAGAVAGEAPAAPERLPIENPQRWDRYELLRLLGRGGMGEVYEARDRRLGRHVAIKFIYGADPVTTRRFLQEARAQARLDHPNVCKVLEVGEVEGKAYIAMQLVPGTSLSQAAKSLALEEKVRVLKTVAEAVHAAHCLGIIHRDIKPANIMLEPGAGVDGAPPPRPVLMDFGLARETGDAAGLTESGAVMGTPSYMPPEQARGDVRSLDARSDVYGLGATLYALLAGAPPFEDDGGASTLLKVLIQEPTPLRARDPSIPRALDTIVGKCLNKEPHHRYASAAELADDLERFLSRGRVRARPLGLPTRLYWRGKRNKPMAFAVLALAFSLFAFAGYGVRTAVVAARAEAVAHKRAELGQKLGQAVKELEWLVRSAHLVPLHDTGPEVVAVRARMAEIEAEMRSFGDLGAGLDHYALGRGHLALKEWGAAHEALRRAEALGVREPDLDYALGRVLGELYRRALEDARRGGDKGYIEKRKQELERDYLAPALARLERCRGSPSVPAPYLEGLIHFYHRRDDEALRDARAAHGQAPWLYEAAQLAGDVFMARALDGKDRGDGDQAGRDFAQAVAHYEQAAEIGRSDQQVYEALAEAWVRHGELDVFRGRDPGPELARALDAADKALRAAPAESSGHTKKAFAYHFGANYAEGHGAARAEIERLRRAQLAAGQAAIAAHPEDAYAHEITGLAYTALALRLADLGEPVEPLLERGRAHLEDAIRRNPRFPWAYNDYGLALAATGIDKKRRNEDPRDLFQRAIATTRKAFELDEEYLIAYNNTSLWLTELALWEADHGGDPEGALREAVRMADRVLQRNDQHPLAYGNSGLALAELASYRLDKGEDGREPARQAIGRFKALLAIDPNLVLAQGDLARSYRLLAAHERALGLDPRPSLDEGRRALVPCYRIEPGNAACELVEAQLKAEQGAWARSRGQPFVALFEQAQRLALGAAQKAPDRVDLWLGLGQICLERAEALLADERPGAQAGPVLDEGLRATERALKLAPGLPRALAVEGALSLHQGRLDPSRGQAAFERARASLSRVFAANPLLERRYGKVVAEADRAPGRR